MQRITVTRNPDALTQQTWDFWFDDRYAELVLDNYWLSARESLRHKFRKTRWYYRTDGRSNTLSLDEVPLPEDVAQEAKAALVNQIVVTKWKDRQ